MRATRIEGLVLVLVLVLLAHGAARGEVPDPYGLAPLRAACASGNEARCHALVNAAAEIQVGDAEWRPDPRAALDIYLDLCTLKQADGCTLAAHLYRKGAEGVPAEPGKALGFYRIACDLGSGGSCMTAGSMLTEDRSLERVTGEALVLFARGCEMKFAKSCEGSAKLRRVLGQPRYDELLAAARQGLRKLEK